MGQLFAFKEFTEKRLFADIDPIRFLSPNHKFYLMTASTGADLFYKHIQRLYKDFEELGDQAEIQAMLERALNGWNVFFYHCY